MSKKKRIIFYCRTFFMVPHLSHSYTLILQTLKTFDSKFNLDGVGRQSKPPDLFLLLADYVHGHEDVESVVHSTPNVFLKMREVIAKGKF